MKRRIASILILTALTVLPVMSQGGLSGISLLQRPGSLLSGNSNLNTSLEIGTGITGFGGGSSMVTSYISPSMSYSFDSGFTLYLGGTFVTGNSGGMPGSVVLRDGSAGASSGTGSHSVFAAGSYKAADNLTISGVIFHEEGYIPFSQPQLNPALGYSMQGASMKLDYSINERLHFGAGITVTQGNSPYYYSPFRSQQNIYGGSPGSLFLRD